MKTLCSPLVTHCKTNITGVLQDYTLSRSYKNFKGYHFEKKILIKCFVYSFSYQVIEITQIRNKQSTYAIKV